MMEFNRQRCEYLRSQAKEKFNQIKGTWLDCGRWAIPHRTKWMQAQTPGERNNNHVVDPTHILSLRSYVAGFLEGNTSASRPWYRIQASDPDMVDNPENHKWLEIFTNRTLACAARSNFYTAAGQFYQDFGGLGSGAHWIDENKGDLFFHTLIPGSYFVINNALGEAVVMVLEFSLTVKGIVDRYGQRTSSGRWDRSNISDQVWKMYDDGDYSRLVDIVCVVQQNEEFDYSQPVGGRNRQWASFTYEVGNASANQGASETLINAQPMDPMYENRALKISYAKRKPFIVGKGDANGAYEYGEKWPTLDALGIIKSLNKKAIAKDQALEQMLRPALQGPATLKKSYITSAANSFIPLDAQSLKQDGLRPIYEVNPAIATLTGDVQDMRQQVDKLYYADYLLYLSRNPKTRTATETNAIVQEQQLIIGPNLQSLNWTYNTPVVEFIMDFVLDQDPYLPPPPDSLAGDFLHVEFVSVFAQAQKAADLPAIQRYMETLTNTVAQSGGAANKLWDKVNLDKFADLLADRLFLPDGLNNPQGKVDALRQQAQAQMQRQQQLDQAVQASQAAKNLGVQMPQGQQNQPQQGLKLA